MTSLKELRDLTFLNFASFNLRKQTTKESSKVGKFKSLAFLCISIFAFVITISLAIFHLYANVFSLLPPFLINTIHFSGFGILLIFVYPPFKFAGNSVLIFFIDLVLALLVAFCAFYLFYSEAQIYDNNLELTNLNRLASIVVIVMSIEYVRRVSGYVIPILIILSLLYLWKLGGYIPGVFSFAGLSFDRILFRTIYSDDGLFGTLAKISSSYIAVFLIFGAFLMKSGASEFINNFANLIAGKFKGGPAFVAVISSALTGTVSGSAIANVASTGVITIPLMKKAGYSNRYAGAVEAASSTGGQLMPPIMGAGAFIIAANTFIPYSKVVLVSILPAVLYFASIAISIRITSLKERIIPVKIVFTLDQRKKLIKQGLLVFFIPIALLITLLVIGFSPTYSAGLSIIAILIGSQFTEKKMRVKQILEALHLASKNTIVTAIILCSIGIVVNSVLTSGIGNTFSLMIQNWSGNNLLLALTLIAFASLILGMGLPVTAAYIVLAILSAPALLNIMVNQELISILIDGEISNTAKQLIIFGLSGQTEIIADFSKALSLAQAKEIIAVMPLEITSQLHKILIPEAKLTLYLLTAHLIIFWLSQDSNVTPPVCLAAFTAAAIAKASPMATGFTAWRVAKGLYIIPIFFAYSHLISNDGIASLKVFFLALFTIYALFAITSNFSESKLRLYEILLLLSAVALTFTKFLHDYKYITILIVIFVMVNSYRRERLVEKKKLNHR